MTLKALLVAAGAATLIAGAANAQTTETDVHVDAAGNVITHSTTSSTPVPNPDGSVTTTVTTPGHEHTVTTSADSALAVGMPASSTVTTRVVTNGPVPDTAENRAKYGQPMSRAGKRSAAAGN